MCNNISGLEVFGIGSYLEHQVLRKIVAVISYMQSREEDTTGIIFVFIIYITIIGPVAIDPPHACLHQVLCRRSCGNTRIAFYIVLRAYIPGVFEHGNRFSFAVPLMLEEICIK